MNGEVLWGDREVVIAPHHRYIIQQSPRTFKLMEFIDDDLHVSYTMTHPEPDGTFEILLVKRGNNVLRVTIQAVGHPYVHFTIVRKDPDAAGEPLFSGGIYCGAIVSAVINSVPEELVVGLLRCNYDLDERILNEQQGENDIVGGRRRTHKHKRRIHRHRHKRRTQKQKH
jgi:hypothetical protein